MSGPTNYDSQGLEMFTEQRPAIVQLADLLDYINEMRDIFNETQQALQEVQSYHYFKSPDEYGAKGNGITDDTQAIQQAVNAGNTLIKAGIYLVDASKPIMIPSNRKITMEKGCIIKVKPNALDTYHVFRMFDTENVTIDGGFIVGDRDQHGAITGESGMGVSIYGGKNIVIKNMIITKTWGDGIYIGKTPSNTMSKNITIENVMVDSVRRNGISVISVDGITLKNVLIQNVNGTLPEAGIDFECNYNDEWVTNINITNTRIVNTNGSGLVFALTSMSGLKPNFNVHIDGLTLNNNKNGFYSSTGDITSDGSVFLNDIKVYESKENGVLIEKWSNKLPKLILNNISITNANEGSNTGFRSASIVFRNSSSDTWNTLSNIDLNNARIYNKNAKAINALIVSPSSNSSDNITINNIYTEGFISTDKIIFTNHTANIFINDLMKQLTLVAGDTPITLVNSRKIKELKTPNFTTKKVVELDQTLSEGNEITISCDNAFGVIIYFENSYGYPLQSTLNGRIETTQKGASITVYRESYGWKITKMVGTWTLV